MRSLLWADIYLVGDSQLLAPTLRKGVKDGRSKIALPV
jgi:hypothetical protein